jgi:hypothetical protein
MTGDMDPEFNRAIRDGDLTIVQRMLREGSASTKQKDMFGRTALLLAVYSAQFPVAEWLLEHGGSSITEECRGQSVWDCMQSWLADGFPVYHCEDERLTSLLRVMVLREDPPASLVRRLAPEHAHAVHEGARLRARLPAYLARRRSLLDEHCPLLPPLLALIRDYNPEPTTAEEIWATGLGADP